MDVKILELRDAGTMIPLLCVNLGNADNQTQYYYLRRLGYPVDGRPNIAVTHLSCDIRMRITNDPHQWGGRTYPVAHDYIIEHWDELRDGDVIDVEFILGETSTKKTSERFGTFTLPNTGY